MSKILKKTQQLTLFNNQEVEPFISRLNILLDCSSFTVQFYKTVRLIQYRLDRPFYKSTLFENPDKGLS